MGMKFSVLASGSTGNAAVVTDGQVNILIDAGLSARKLDALMKQIGFSGESIDVILVTHEHDDHIKGLGPLARKYQLPIYANTRTWEQLDKQIGPIEADKKMTFATGAALDFDSMRVESYEISHDAAEPVGFCFYHQDQKLSFATDLGYMSRNVREKLSDSDVIVLESNHDINMLRMGKYPWNIKRRILSDTGHLSNEAAGEALCELISKRMKRIYLAHLSRDHNVMDIAKMTVTDVMEQGGISLSDQNIQLMDTYYDRPTGWDLLQMEG